MTSRVEELAARRKLLLAQSTLQRQALRLDAAVIGETLSAVDRAVAGARRLGRSRLLIGAAVVGVVVFRRHPAVGWIMRGIALAGTARRIGATLGRLSREAAAGTAESP